MLVLRPLWLTLLLITVAMRPVSAAPTSDSQTLTWLKGPSQARLGDQAVLTVPEGYAFLGPRDARVVLAQMGNVPSDEEVGLVAPVWEQEHWFVVIRYTQAGYVRDEEARSWDAGAIMSVIKHQAEAANRTRAAKGIPVLHVTGWEEQPRYEEADHKVTWAVTYEDKDGAGVNYHTLALGRYGYISMNMVGDLDLLPHLMRHSRTLLANLHFVPGKRYQDFNPRTDKVAAVGLATVIAGSAFQADLLHTLYVAIVSAVTADTPLVALSVFALAALATLATRLHRKKSGPPLEACPPG